MWSETDWLKQGKVESLSDIHPSMVNIVKSSLGPVSLDRMMMNDVEDTTIANNGATTLKPLKIEDAISARPNFHGITEKNIRFEAGIIEVRQINDEHITTEQDEAGLETSVPQSRCPPEYWGLSTGAEVLVIPAIILQLTPSSTRPSLSCLSRSLAQVAAKALLALATYSGLASR